MNKVILTGNVASDPESRTTQSGISQCQFRLAVQRRFTNQQGVRETDFFPIICWRQTADFCARYITKGSKIAVDGNIQTRTYDAQDGSKRYITEIIADNIEFIGSRNVDGAAPAPQSAPAPQRPAPAAAANSFTNVADDDELPF